MEQAVKFRLIKHITFLENEIQDYAKFESLSWKEYNEERSKRRDVERWVENIINSSIDISKIILTSEKISLPDTYKEIVFLLSLVPDFDKENAQKLSQYVKLRNIVSHEYLDIKWVAIKNFVSDTKRFYGAFLNQTKKYIERKMAEEKPD